MTSEEFQKRSKS